MQVKTSFLHIALLLCGLFLVNHSTTAQVLLPQYSVWEGFAFDDKQSVESRGAEERFARFLLSIEQQTPLQQASQIGELLAKAEQHNATARFLVLADKYLLLQQRSYSVLGLKTLLLSGIVSSLLTHFHQHPNLLIDHHLKTKQNQTKKH